MSNRPRLDDEAWFRRIRTLCTQVTDAIERSRRQRTEVTTAERQRSISSEPDGEDAPPADR